MIAVQHAMRLFRNPRLYEGVGRPPPTKEATIYHISPGAFGAGGERVPTCWAVLWLDGSTWTSIDLRFPGTYWAMLLYDNIPVLSVAMRNK